MSSLQMWKDKLTQTVDSMSKKDWGIAGVGAFAITAFLIFRHIHHQKPSAVHRIHEIQQLITNSLQKAQKSREPLIIQQQHEVHSGELTMLFTLVSKLKQKQRDSSESVRNPFLPPFQEGLFVKQLGSKHRLLFNKYNIYQQHLLIVTREFEPQANPLTLQDFKQTILTYKAIRGLFFFNSGLVAGATQIHKHLQVFPNQARDMPIFRSILEYSRQLKRKQQKLDNPQQIKILQYPPFNFLHGLVLLNDTDDVITLKQQTYLSYLKMIKHFSNIDQDMNYNLIGCEHFLLLIPRRREKAFNDLSVSAVGFMGSLLFKDKALMSKYIDQRRQPQRIFEDITFGRKAN